MAAAIPPMTRVSNADFTGCFFTISPLTAPTITNASPVRIIEYKNWFFSTASEKSAKIKEIRGIKPIRRNEIKVASPVFKGCFPKFRYFFASG